MPVLFDLALVDRTHRRTDVFRFEATVDLVDGEPALVQFGRPGRPGARRGPAAARVPLVDARSRWSPGWCRALIVRGIDPFEHDYPVDGFPGVIDRATGPANRALSDEFLEQIAREYLEHRSGLRPDHRPASAASARARW